MESIKIVGVLGATSFVGSCVLTLLSKEEIKITAFSRKTKMKPVTGIHWQQLPGHQTNREDTLPHWICLAPVWVLPEYFNLLESYGIQRIVVLSSTSLFTKKNASHPADQLTARKLADAEYRLRKWAQENNIDWVVLRPTLIYGMGLDKNITEIGHFIRRFGFFPLFGKADGLRQPVHCEDIAAACITALKRSHLANEAYNLSGGETLKYRDMVIRIFQSMNMKPRLFSIPIFLFNIFLMCIHLLPRYKHWSIAMVERMNQDMVFDHTKATRELAYKPRPFRLSEKDILSH